MLFACVNACALVVRLSICVMCLCVCVCVLCDLCVSDEFVNLCVCVCVSVLSEKQILY